MSVNLALIQDLLRPGLLAVTGKYPQISTDYSKVFKTVKSTMALERSAEMRMLGLARLKGEGANIEFDNSAGQAYVYNQEHLEIALGFAVTQKAIEDNLYEKDFNLTALNMTDAFSQTKEVFAANVFNSGTTYNQATGGDGQALFSTAHPVKGTTVGNRASGDPELNETTLLNAMTGIRTNWRDAAGLKFRARGKKLIVHPGNEQVAVRLTKTEMRPGTTDNDVNAVLSVAGGLSDGYMVMEFLTAVKPWFVQTDVPGLLYMERVKFDTQMHSDPLTNNLLVTGRERYSFGYNNWRAVYGSFPT